MPNRLWLWLSCWPYSWNAPCNVVFFNPLSNIDLAAETCMVSPRSVEEKTSWYNSQWCNIYVILYQWSQEGWSKSMCIFVLGVVPPRQPGFLDRSSAGRIIHQKWLHFWGTHLPWVADLKATFAQSMSTLTTQIPNLNWTKLIETAEHLTHIADVLPSSRQETRPLTLESHKPGLYDTSVFGCCLGLSFKYDNHWESNLNQAPSNGFKQPWIMISQPPMMI